MAPATAATAPRIQREVLRMTLDLALLLTVTGFSAATGFVAYWMGVSAAESRAKAREAELLADLDFAVELLTAEPMKPVLRVVGK